MNRALAVFLAVAVLAAPAAAQGPARALELEGEPGVWLPADYARRALEATTLRPGLERRITLLEERLTLEQERVELFRGALEVSEDARRSLVRTVRHQQRARRNPFLWLAVGVVVGVLLGTAPVLAR